MLPLPPEELIKYAGLILLFILGTGAVAWIQEFVKRRMFAKNGGPHTDVKLLERLDHIADRLKELTEMCLDVAESGERRAKKALDQHEVIIDKLDELDVPRNHHK